MVADKRRFPRTGGGELAELKSGRASYPVTLDSLSPEGAGFVADGPIPDDFVAGKRVDVHLLSQRLELPATVTWSSRSNPNRPRGGLHVELAIAPASQRQRFVEWVVGRLRRAL